MRTGFPTLEMKVNVIGDSLVDLSFGLPREYIHRYTQMAKIELPFGAKLSTDGYLLSPGGGGANLAIGLKQAGYKVFLQTGLAGDSFGDFLRQYLDSKGVELETISVGDQTAISVILRVQGERTIITGRSTGSGQPERFPDEGWIHLGPLHGDVEDFITRFLAHQVKTGQETSVNPSMEMIEERSRGLLSLLKSTTVLVLNKLEALTLTRLPHRTGMDELIQSLARLGPKIVCVTDGENGASVASSEVKLFAPALRGKGDRLDATGAGDAFTTGLVAGYLNHRDDLSEAELLRRCLGYGISNSASVVSAIGAHEGLLSLEDLEADVVRVRVRSLQ